MATPRGIKIGDSKAAMQQAYQEEIDNESSDEDILIIGSVFGGMQIQLKNGTVSEIFIVAGAE